MALTCHLPSIDLHWVDGYCAAATWRNLSGLRTL
jgi:hypothetical protein